MRRLFWKLFIDQKMDGDHVEVTDPQGVRWVKKERMEDAVNACDFHLTLRVNHIEDVIDVLRNEELVDPCGFALELLAAHGYDINPPHTP